MKSKNAFTLVELAIVLVIIGLITGGVLGAQSIIESAKRASLIKDLKDTQQAVLAYKLEFDALPGDHKEATEYFTNSSDARLGNGNGDKKIGVAASTSAARQEEDNFWRHLREAKIVDSIFHSLAVNSIYYKVASYDSEATMIYKYSTSESKHVLNYNRFQAEQSNSTYKINGGIITPFTGKQIDKKIDDGVGSSGDFYGVRPYGRGVSWTCSTSYVGSGKLTGDWRVTNNSLTNCRAVLVDK